MIPIPGALPRTPCPMRVELLRAALKLLDADSCQDQGRWRGICYYIQQATIRVLPLEYEEVYKQLILSIEIMLAPHDWYHRWAVDKEINPDYAPGVMSAEHARAGRRAWILQMIEEFGPKKEEELRPSS